jgi:hypothetical protein
MTDSNMSVDTGEVPPEKTGDVEKYGSDGITSDSITSGNETADSDSKYPTGMVLWSILGPVTIAYFLVFLDMCVVSTATPAITQRFNSLIDVGWYGGAYQLGSSALQPLTGKIYSHFNIKVSASGSQKEEKREKGKRKREKKREKEAKQREDILTLDIVVIPRLLLHLRARICNLWSGRLIANVHRR